MKRLWIVRVVYEGYVLAASEAAAMDAFDEIERSETAAVEATLAGREMLDGWEDDFLVYGSPDKDITLAEARLMTKQGAP